MSRSVSLYVYVYLSFSDLVLEETQIGDPLPPKVHVYLLTLAYIYMQPYSEQVVQEEHPIGVAISEAPRLVITYPRIVSRNVILVSRNLNKCI